MLFSWKFNFRFNTSLIVNLIETINHETQIHVLSDSFCFVVIEGQSDAHFFSPFKEKEVKFLAIMANINIQPSLVFQTDTKRITSLETKKPIIYNHQLYQRCFNDGVNS